jgi:hypothetical protein
VPCLNGELAGDCLAGKWRPRARGGGSGDGGTGGPKPDAAAAAKRPVRPSCCDAPNGFKGAAPWPKNLKRVLDKARQDKGRGVAASQKTVNSLPRAFDDEQGLQL